MKNQKSLPERELTTIYNPDHVFWPHSKKITEPMLSNWILHRRHIHWGNTCLFLPPTTCFTITVNEIKVTQFVLLIWCRSCEYKNSIPKQIMPGLEPTTFGVSHWYSTNVPYYLVQILWNWTYLERNIFLAFILPTLFPISRADKSLSSNPSLQKISLVVKQRFHGGETYPGWVLRVSSMVFHYLWIFLVWFRRDDCEVRQKRWRIRGLYCAQYTPAVFVFLPTLPHLRS